MKNIMNAQLYKLRKDKISIFTFFAVLVLSIALIFVFFNTIISTGGAYTGGEEVVISLTMFTLFAQFFLYVFTANFCGADFTDKTCNYEIMAGHTRAQVFFGRAIPCVIIGTLCTMILMAAPLVAEVALLGWGDKVKFSDILLRFLLLAFPIARISCEYIFLTYLIKNPYIVMGISYLLCILLGYNIPEGQANSPILGMSNINMLGNIDFWTSYGLNEENMYMVYDTALSTGDIVSTIVTSLIFMAGSLFLGYSFFKNDDMH